ncbi:hypothetical protein [Caballeronia sp. RCC_10]|uniref:hypothetical protein n=1 Tax=Caballeronia sp. RCC_10 TaxID=3239227 RepID=UPI003524C454
MISPSISTSAHGDHERHYTAAVEFMHVIFRNWLAPAMTLVGGCLFASTCREERSLTLCCAEHALFGGLISPPGLDRYSFVRHLTQARCGQQAQHVTFDRSPSGLEFLEKQPIRLL